jgi:magnesium transporter
MSTESESALGLVFTGVPVGGPDERAGSVSARLDESSLESGLPVWVVEQGRLVGVVPLAVLLRAAPEAPLRGLAREAPPSVEVTLDQERVALHALAYGLEVVPVTKQGHFVGVVPAQKLLDVLRREHIEDLHRMAGMAREDTPSVHSLEEPPTRRAAHRLPWLVVGLAGSLLAGLLMDGFEQTLQRRLEAAFFVPAIVYLADAVGTQTEALVIRGLSHTHRPLSQIFFQELGSGVVLGAILGSLAGAGVGLLWADQVLGLVVGLAIFAACSVATALGMVLPWALSAARLDPAFGSGPLATILQDLLSLLIYLGLVALVL